MKLFVQPAAFEIPRLRALARHAVPHLLEATVAPLVLFYLAMWAMGLGAALASALVWAYGAIALRRIRGRRVPGILLIGAMTLTVRTVITLASGQVFVYFLQPSLGTIAVGAAFLSSVALKRPLAQRLAADFCPLPDDFAGHPRVARFFSQISLLWGLVYMVNAAATLSLLFSQSIGVFMIGKTVVSLTCTVLAVALSTVWFKTSMKRHGLLAGSRAAVPVGASA
jgi:intracellular septation protein A